MSFLSTAPMEQKLKTLYWILWEVDANVLNHDLLSEVALISNEEGMVLLLSSFH